MRPFLLGVVASCVLVLTSPVATASAQTTDISLNALVDETQQRGSEPHDLTLVWWLPEEFWRLSVGANAEVSAEVLDSLVAMVHPFTMVAALSGHASPSSVTFRYVSTDSLRASLVLIDGAGVEHRPLETTMIPPATQAFLDLIGPMMAQLLGNLGQNLNFFLFDGLTADGARLLEPRSPGQFTIRLLKYEFRWRLPLASLVPRKRCPVDGELLSGAWRFCPWHGAELAAIQ